MHTTIIRTETRATPENTKAIRDELATATCAVIDGKDLFFIFDDGHKEVGGFEAFVLLAHALGVKIDWDATF